MVQNGHTFFSCHVSYVNKAKPQQQQQGTRLRSHFLQWSCRLSASLPDDLPSLSGEGTLSGISNKEYDVYSDVDSDDDVEDDEDGEEHYESASESPSSEFSPSMLTQHTAPSTSLKQASAPSDSNSGLLSAPPELRNTL